ncbi:MAG TPA: amidase [Candidatus Dormibacteraeota bacterium]|nr:amidase [Candidatus Dormibacteraeota bacterium]
MNNIDLAFASIEEIAKLYRQRKLSPVELTQIILQRIERLNPKLNAYLTFTPEIALAQAKRAESELFVPRGRKSRRDRGTLHGIPISLKDNICTAGIRTTAGSKVLSKFVPEQDATVVTHLKEAGSVLLGKTHMHEFAYGTTTNNPHYGPARNPWNIECVPGGSSGGSAAAVAAGLCFASVGTDTGGSLRIPAALCGVTGLKPTHGNVSDEGIIPLSPSLDCTGPLARSSRDAAILLRAISKQNTFPSSSWSPAKLFRKPSKIRLGIPQEFFFDVLVEEVANYFDRALRDLRKLGAQMKELSIPLLNETEDAGNQIAWPEATQYHRDSGYFPARATEYGEDVRSRLEMGDNTSAVAYLEALELQKKFAKQLREKMDEAGVDALVVPTTPIAAPLIGEEKTQIDGKSYLTRALLLRLNRPANLAGVPAISIPCGVTSSGLPIGLQFIGRHNSDLLLLQIANFYQNAYPNARRPLL